jgi:hypothetical protein
MKTNILSVAIKDLLENLHNIRPIIRLRKNPEIFLNLEWNSMKLEPLIGLLGSEFSE